MADPAFTPFDEDPIRRVELALEDLRQGRMVILVDDEDRENEGDLVLAAEKVTPEAINFMATHGRGLICLSLTGDQVERLGLPMMAANNQSPYNTAFTVSIEAREGVTTGISAADRARTTLVAIDPKATQRDIVTPGHMFPLRAREGGVLERVGQTEGSVDLSRLAGLNPSGLICEVMNPDGTMSRLPDLLAFGTEHRIRVVAVADIIKYRMRTERVVRRAHTGSLDACGVTWRAHLYQGLDGEQHLALAYGDLSRGPTLARVQAAPPAWSLFGDAPGRVARQGLAAQRAIVEAGAGVLVLMHLAGTSEEHLRHSFVQDFSSPAEAPPAVARAEALRDLGTGCQILVDLGLEHLRLLSASTRPIVGVEAYGLHIDERVPL